MILRQLISTFLIQALLLTSINAYVPKGPQEEFKTSKVLNWEERQGTAQSNDLAIMVEDSSVSEFSPRNDDMVYAELPPWALGAVVSASLAYYFFKTTSLLLNSTPSKKLLEKIYTLAELEALCSQGPRLCAKIEDRFYFIDQGFVFSYDSNYQVKQYVARHAQEIVNYKNTLAVLNKISKTVWFIGYFGTRIHLNSVYGGIESIVSNDDTLLALTKQGSVWAFHDSPDKIQMTITDRRFLVLPPIHTEHRTATIDGKKVGFKRIDLSAKAINLHVEKGNIVIELEDHSLVTLEEISGKLQCKALVGQILTPRP